MFLIHNTDGYSFPVLLLYIIKSLLLIAWMLKKSASFNVSCATNFFLWLSIAVWVFISLIRLFKSIFPNDKLNSTKELFFDYFMAFDKWVCYKCVLPNEWFLWFAL